MVFRTLELNIISAKDLKDVNLFSQQMSVYAIVSIIGDPLNPQITTTHIHRHAGRNPTWNIPVKFTVNESLAYYNRLSLEVKLISYRKFLPCSTIGKVRIPLKGLLDNPANAGHPFSYEVRKNCSGKSKGTLNLSYKFGDRFYALVTTNATKNDGLFIGMVLCLATFNKCDKDAPVTTIAIKMLPLVLMIIIILILIIFLY